MAETRQPAAMNAERVLDRLPCGVLVFDDDGHVEYVNTTLTELLGREPAEVVGQHVESLLSVASRIFFQTHLYPLVRLHGSASELFILLRRKDGTDVGALMNAVRREAGGRALVECVMVEVRERRKFEDALLRAKQAAEAANDALSKRSAELEDANRILEEQAIELEAQQEQLHEQSLELEAQRAAADAANQAKSQFLAAMSHELRTPLNAIGGYAQLIELGIHGAVTDAQLEALGRILRAQQHLLRLVNDVLDLARIEAGRMEYVLGRVTVAELMEVVMPMVQPQLDAGGLTYRADLAGGLAALADREKVQQILINLLTNAIKFTPSGGSVTVTARLDEASRRVDISVRDSGIGIPAEKLTGIFEPFIQVETEHARRKQGSGLGLTISRDLARGMGGELSATSVEGQGSTFTLSLPATT